MNGFAVTIEVTLTEIADDPEWWLVRLWTPGHTRQVTIAERQGSPLFSALMKVALASGVALDPEAD